MDGHADQATRLPQGSGTGRAATLAGTLPFVSLSSHDPAIPLLATALFVRGLGISAVGVPAITCGYVARADLSMAPAAKNIVQRLRGLTQTTVCATLLAWRMTTVPGPDGLASAFTVAFGLLCVLNVVLLASVWGVPWSIPARPSAVT